MLTNEAISGAWDEMADLSLPRAKATSFLLCEVGKDIRIVGWNGSDGEADLAARFPGLEPGSLLFGGPEERVLRDRALAALAGGRELRLRLPGTVFAELNLAPVFGADRRLTHCLGMLEEGEPAHAERPARDGRDEMTRLPNRQRFQHHLTTAIGRAADTDGQIAVLTIDLDRFKLVNDSLGVAAGNRLLQAAAERLRGTVRLGDVVACFGGDDFAMLIDGLKSAMDSAKVTEKLLAEISQPFVIDGERVVCTASIGISCYPQDGQDADLLIHQAHAAQTEAKAAGGNTHRFFASRMNQREIARFVIGNQLRQALDRDELTLHYQPRSDLKTGAITGLEALIRWQHPTEGLLPPARFIPIAEQTRLIETIDDWVLRAACGQMHTWKVAGLAPPRVAVNLSARQFRRRELPQHIAATLGEFGLSPDELEIEITESLAMHDPHLATRLLGELHEIGIMLAIDDFGTGHCSLAYLKRFPVDFLKIDRSFVTDLPDDPHDVAITSAIIVLARQLGLRLIAEGVETERQRQFLAAKGCDELQGFLLSRPKPVEELESILRAAASGPAPGMNAR